MRTGLVDGMLAGQRKRRMGVPGVRCGPHSITWNTRCSEGRRPQRGQAGPSGAARSRGGTRAGLRALLAPGASSTASDAAASLHTAGFTFEALHWAAREGSMRCDKTADDESRRTSRGRATQGRPARWAATMALTYHGPSPTMALILPWHKTCAAAERAPHRRSRAPSSSASATARPRADACRPGRPESAAGQSSPASAGAVRRSVAAGAAS